MKYLLDNKLEDLLASERYCYSIDIYMSCTYMCVTANSENKLNALQVGKKILCIYCLRAQFMSNICCKQGKV